MCREVVELARRADASECELGNIESRRSFFDAPLSQQAATTTKKILFNWALNTGGRFSALKRDQKPVPASLAFQHRLAEKLVLGKIRAIFGGRNKFFNCGGSAFSAEIAEFFFNTGVLLLQGYGLTECFPICIANETHNKFGTCGPVLPLVDVRVSPEGEIQARGPAVMQGYYKKPELTREMFTEDGWIKTGDIGTVDAEGYLTITDRIKDMMKTSLAGENWSRI